MYAHVHLSKSKTSVLNMKECGEKMFEAYNIVFEHFFCIVSLIVVYGLKRLKVKTIYFPS